MFAENQQEILTAGQIAEVQEILQQGRKVLPVGGRSKAALSAASPEGALLDLSALTGLLAYEPEEFTFTAYAGTPVAEIEKILAREGQYLPFDPPLAAAGATLGGTVAAGLSGSGRYLYGGVRDFILGVGFVDGEGRLVRAGGRVVKNSAGFDLPKLMVGSLGSLGAIVEVTFKVFPRPGGYLTLQVDCSDIEAALKQMSSAAASRLDIAAIDLTAEAGGYCLWLRMGGDVRILKGRMRRLQSLVGGQVLSGRPEREFWAQSSNFAWVPAGWSLIKVPLTPSRLPALEAEFATLAAGQPILRRYAAGGQVGWLAVQAAEAELHDLLSRHHLAGLKVLGPPGRLRLGEWPEAGFYRRVKQALDPTNRFVEV